MPITIDTIDALADEVTARLWVAAKDRAAPAPLIGVSGIDASGKGFVAAAMSSALEARGLRVATIPLDPWHTPGPERLAPPGSPEDAGERFYRRAFRWDVLFGSLIEPLCANRAISLVTRLITPADDTPRPCVFEFDGIDLVLLEGVFLFRRDLAPRFGMRVWVECGFETAMTRALARNQEGLDPAGIRAEYERVYWPAQRLHARLDNPRATAHVVLLNDPALR